jgi:hypothetical protein
MFRFIKAICFICFAKTNGFLGNLTANVVIRQYSSDITPGIEKRRQNAKKWQLKQFFQCHIIIELLFLFVEEVVKGKS